MNYGKLVSVKGKKTKPPAGVHCIECGELVVADKKDYHYIQSKFGTTHFIHIKCFDNLRNGGVK